MREVKLADPWDSLHGVADVVTTGWTTGMEEGIQVSYVERPNQIRTTWGMAGVQGGAVHECPSTDSVGTGRATLVAAVVDLMKYLD